MFLSLSTNVLISFNKFSDLFQQMLLSLSSNVPISFDKCSHPILPPCKYQIYPKTLSTFANPHKYRTAQTS